MLTGIEGHLLDTRAFSMTCSLVNSVTLSRTATGGYRVGLMFLDASVMTRAILIAFSRSDTGHWWSWTIRYCHHSGASAKCLQMIYLASISISFTTLRCGWVSSP